MLVRFAQLLFELCFKRTVGYTEWFKKNWTFSRKLLLVAKYHMNICYAPNCTATFSSSSSSSSSSFWKLYAFLSPEDTSAHHNFWKCLFIFESPCVNAVKTKATRTFFFSKYQLTLYQLTHTFVYLRVSSCYESRTESHEQTFFVK